MAAVAGVGGGRLRVQASVSLLDGDATVVGDREEAVAVVRQEKGSS